MSLSLAPSLRAAIAAGVALYLCCASAVAEPALWVAKGPNATVYLFGTIHVLRQGQAWETPAIAQALASSRALWLEVTDMDDQGERQTLVSQLGLDPTRPLSSKLTHADLKRLDAAAKSVGMPDGEKTLETMRPWLAAIVLTGGLVERAGYDSESGIDRRLLHDDATVGKPVHGFETMDQQLHFLADVPPPLELDMLKSMLRDFDKGSAELDALVDMWSRGDEAAATRYVVKEEKNSFPALYRVLFVERNAAWADKIAAMVAGTGVSFVAVGFLHFAGPDSLQHALAQRGVRVERVAATP